MYRKLSQAITTWTALGLAAACSSSSDAPSRPPQGTAAVGGLDQRPVNRTCIAPERSSAGNAAIALTPVFSGLAFVEPLGMLQAPGDATRWFVLEKAGRVRVFANDPAVASFDTDFIDLDLSFDVNSSSEGGLLGMAFDPAFATNGRAYLSWTEGSPMVSVVARFRSLDGGATLDPGSREDVLRIDQDFGNHNGGHILFGPDGHLYAGFGDGGSGGDPLSRAQDTTNLLGALLRLDVTGGTPYAVPPGNPFAGNPPCPADHSSGSSCPEIYAWGLRNPWRWSFDRATGALWAGDVGQVSFEEIDRIELGRNYGWDCREGNAAFNEPAASCATATGLADPVHTYGRSQGASVTGGHVYRGSAMPGLVGQYVFGDFVSGRIWRLVDGGGGGFVADELIDSDSAIASFAEDQDAELYVVDLNGRLFRIADGGGLGVDPNPLPNLLSQVGCFDPADPSEPTPAMVAYTVAAAFWSDGAEKERWMAIPDGSTIAVAADGDFDYPVGSVLAKHFRLDGALVETRLFMRHPDGGWAGYSYEWDAQQTDATIVVGGKTETISGQDWLYPDAGQCLICHTEAAGFSLGLETRQLNNALRYAATGRTANQLRTLDAIAMFASPLGDPGVQPALGDPFGTAGSLDDRARAYLHTNCANCHRPGGPTPVAIDLRSSTGLAATGACDAVPQSGDLGIANAVIVAPGDPDRSVLLERIGRRDDPAQMPPLASFLPDTAGIALIRDWITGLQGC